MFAVWSGFAGVNDDEGIEANIMYKLQSEGALYKEEEWHPNHAC